MVNEDDRGSVVSGLDVVIKKLDEILENQEVQKELLDELWEKVDNIGYSGSGVTDDYM